MALPIRIESGRIERPKLLVQDRLCPCCKDGQSIETEEHFIFYCAKYNNLRKTWLSKITKPQSFSNLNIGEKLKVIFDQAENVKATAQYIINCYDFRSKIVFV